MQLPCVYQRVRHQTEETEGLPLANVWVTIRVSKQFSVLFGYSKSPYLGFVSFPSFDDHIPDAQKGKLGILPWNNKAVNVSV